MPHNMLGAFLQKLDSLLHFLHLHLTVFLSGVTKKFNLEWSTKKLHFNSSFSCALQKLQLLQIQIKGKDT